MNAERPSKRATRKKTTAKKSTGKSTAARKSAPKKTTPKKKAASKPVAAMKSSRKKTSAKKPTTRRTSPAAQPLSESVRRAESLAESAASRAAAKAAKRGRANQREEFFSELHGDHDAGALSTALERVLNESGPGGAEAGPAPRAFPGQNLNKWVPIGPTVTRRGQAMSRPRTSGRIRDIEVSANGQRAYAASAKGGVWYTGDAGVTWAPVGGWASRSTNAQGNGNMFSTGALLVSFGATEATDFVMVGTGEPRPGRTPVGAGAQGGVGVLAGLGPLTQGVDVDPWERDAGLALLSGVGVRRLARHPSATAGSNSGATQDRVLAATTDGLYLGVRSALPAVAASPPPAPGQPAQPSLPARDGYTWTTRPVAPKGGNNDVTDVVWLANGAATRIVYAITTLGVFISDDNGLTPTPIAALQNPLVNFNNRISLARVPGTSRIYALAEVMVGGVPTSQVWQITDVINTPQTVVPVPGVPTDLFGDPTQPPTQAWYDQAIAVETVGTNDRLYLGGSTVMPRGGAAGEWSGSLFCFETPAPPAAVAALSPASGVSRRRNPPSGDGADRNGLIGNNVHADIHMVKLAGPAAPTRHVWVGCDGGVYVSEHSGRVNTFASRNAGMATLEPIFMANHPTSSHFMFVGFQDNGSQVRVGDTVWEAAFVGDGGGSVIHPIRTDVVVGQYTNANWNGSPANLYRDPMTRRRGSAGTVGRESTASAFYSGAAAIADTATTGRVALGTNRVWITDNLGAGGTQRWRTLPYPAGTERDTRPGGGDPAAQRRFGVPSTTNAAFFGNADQVIDMVWQSGTVLLVLYRGGLVRYTNSDKAAGTWATTTWLWSAPLPVTAVGTAVAAAPSPSLDFYVTMLGDPTRPTQETLWFYDDVNTTFIPTGFRQVLDFPGPPVVAGPVDPCFSVAVDPTNAADVYVGTATGVWKGRRQVAGNWVFVPFMNGLPHATVQDLRFWQDPAGAATSPRLLRAGIQSRGMWEVDVARADPRRTYVRVHGRDDRRILPSPLANPRRRPGATPEVEWASPDIVVRPAWPVAAPPRFHATLTPNNNASYDLWTFQTAFRWLYPSCVADGRWSDAMQDLVRFHRSVLGLSAATRIDRDLWRQVVGNITPAVTGIRLRPDPGSSSLGSVTSAPADSPAVYRAPWHTTLNFDGHATEIDLMESVVPVRSTGSEWTVFREPSTVDVLLHHRDSRPVPPGSAFVVLLWRFAPTSAALRATGSADLAPYLAGVVAAGAGAPPATPAGWTLASAAGGAAMRPLTTLLDARLPRAVSIDVDLSVVPNNNRVMFLALVGSGADDLIPPPAVAPPTVSNLVQNWPNAAIRIVRARTRT